MSIYWVIYANTMGKKVTNKGLKTSSAKDWTWWSGELLGCKESGLFVFDTCMDGDGGDGAFSFTSLSNPESIGSEHFDLFKGV